MVIKKIYDIGPQIWRIECPKIYKVSNEDIKFIKKTLKNEWMKFIAAGKSSWGKNLDRYIWGKWAITITICKSDDATERGLQTS